MPFSPATYGIGETSTTARSKPRARRSRSALIVRWSSSGVSAITSACGGSTRRGITSTVVERYDRASSVSDYLVVRESGKDLIPVMGGTYKDEWVRQGGTWRFWRKELVHDIAGDMGLKNMGLKNMGLKNKR